MNWGTKIVIVFTLFVAGIVAMVIKSSRQNTDLVVPDYYEQELKYQDRLDEINRTGALSAKVECRVDSLSLHISLPPEMATQQVVAEAWLYCIADKKRDIKKQLQTGNGRLQLPITAFNKGMHEVKLSWKTGDGQSYYYQQKLFIQ